jgi:hypothetical protein
MLLQRFDDKGDCMRALESWFAVSTFVLAIASIGSANAADVMQTKNVGPYKVELHVLPAEPFFSKQEVVDKRVKEGMEVEGGATPVTLDAASHPNHHLVVHVFDKTTGKAVTDATVTVNFTALDAKGNASGAPNEVPVVIMQAIGKGPASTHYGNNVTMPAGRYNVAVTVNGDKGAFTITAADAPPSPMKHMKMDHMKM